MFDDLCNQINKYLDGEQNLDHLESWLVGNLQNILDSNDKTAQAIADELDADFVWLGEGLVDEADLRSRLFGYVRAVSLSSAITNHPLL